MSSWFRSIEPVGRRAVMFLQPWVALVAALQIIYSPVHLALEPHGEDGDCAAAGLSGRCLAFLDAEAGEDHHHDHSAAQHMFQATAAMRVPAPEMALVTACEFLEVAADSGQRKHVPFSGLSPPELPHSWQFLLRTALPPRSPSALS